LAQGVRPQWTAQTFLGQAREVRRQDRRGYERGYVLRIGWAVLQPAPNRGEPNMCLLLAYVNSSLNAER
jgi:hypothetical protein